MALRFDCIFAVKHFFFFKKKNIYSTQLNRVCLKNEHILIEIFKNIHIYEFVLVIVSLMKEWKIKAKYLWLWHSFKCLLPATMVAKFSIKIVVDFLIQKQFCGGGGVKHMPLIFTCTGMMTSLFHPTEILRMIQAFNMNLFVLWN